MRSFPFPCRLRAAAPLAASACSCRTGGVRSSWRRAQLSSGCSSPTGTLHAVLTQSRRCYRFNSAEVISPDDVSFFSEPSTGTPDGNGADEQNRRGRKARSSAEYEGDIDRDDEEALAAAASPHVPSVFEEVGTTDAFSRARVVNFVKRHAKRSRIDGAKDVFMLDKLSDVTGTQGGTGDDLFHCRLELPLPHPSSEDADGPTSLWAHGVGCEEKEAELLAAMHAERIIDALGYHIYTLPSMQRKHALAARRAGRVAPFPSGDDDAGRGGAGGASTGAVHRPAAAAFPKPLRRVRARDETEDGKWQLIDLARENRFQSASPSTTLLSPCVFDEGAQSRVQLFLRAKGVYFVDVLTVETVAPLQKGEDPFFVASLTFPHEVLGTPSSHKPHSDAETKVIAQGKARVKEQAVTLACMHAELMLDALEVPLFPQDDGKQKEHAMTAWGYGRPAPLCGATAKDPLHVVLPLPIKELVVSGRDGARFSLRSGEEDLVLRHRAVTSQTTDFAETAVGESTAVADVKAFFKAMKQPRAGNPFFHEVIQGMVKSTVVLPVADGFGIRGGVGIAGRGADADVLAAMHALDILTALGVPVHADPTKQARWAAERSQKVHDGKVIKPVGPADPSPPGWRLVSGAKTFTRMVEVSAAGPATERPAQPESTDTATATSPNAGESAAGGSHGRKPRRVVKRAKMVEQPEAPSTADTSQGQPQASAKAEAGAAKTDEMEETLVAARARVPRELWDLEPDSPDGYIMVAPQSRKEMRAAEATFSDAALRSPRELDPLVKSRITQYLATVGRRFEDVFRTQFLDVDDNGGQGVHRCVAKLPIPHRFGDRVAIGEAAHGPDAEQLAAMHAELILDALGLCLCTDGTRQRRHAEACAQFGRWAPSGPGQERAANTKSPPPLRREYVGSLHWERLQERKRVKVMTVPRARPDETARSADGADTTHTRGAAASCATRSGTAPVVDTLPSMEIDEAAEYTTVTEAELDLVAKPRVQYYLRRRQESEVDTQYTVVMGRGTILHEAAWSLPLPEAVLPAAACAVKGIATTKREAEILSWMHAERVLDALGVPIFDNLPRLQQWHAAQAAKQGRAVAPPLSQRGACGTQAALPHPLRLAATTNGSDGRPVVVPVHPDHARVHEADVWAAYVESCAVFIQERKLASHNAFFELDRVPRTGEPLVDQALDAVESEPAETDSKMLLNSYCLAAGTQYPAYWKSQTVGPLMHRVSWAVIPVPGFEYVFAQGVGPNKEVAQRRTAMHALKLLSHIDPDYPTHFAKARSLMALSADGTANTAAASPDASEEDEDEFDLETFTVSLMPPAKHDESSGRSLSRVNQSSRAKRKEAVSAAYDAKLGAFTAEGNVRLVELLTLCMGVPPPVTLQTVRLTQESVSAPRAVRLSTTVSFTDDDGKVWDGASSAAGRQRREHLAYEELVGKLEKHMASFRAVKDLLVKDPYLDPRMVPNVTLSAALRDRIHAAVGNGPVEGEGEEIAVDLAQLAADRRAAAAEVVDDAVAQQESTGDHNAREASRLFSFLAMTQSQVAQESQYLLEKYQEKITTAAYLESYAKARERLSITPRKEEILRGIEAHSVLIICGTTGCGKTTQVPQFILDSMTNEGRGGECSILVTQPRRLSAVSIAQRVAAERLERIGDSTGYTIRFDARPGKHINFCTSGILLRMLHSSPTLEGINYLIIDEIHERDINSDFLIILLRELLAKRPDLRVVLMSATLQAEQFGHYFNNAPIINVEGHVYPVEELYLEDLVPFAEARNFMTPLLKEAANVRAKALRNARVTGDGGGGGERGDGDGGGHRRYDVLEVTTDIDYPTIQFAIEQAVRMVDLSSSSVLVFLPGWEEITRAKDILERDATYHIIALHSSVGQEEQMQCFLPAPEGKIKVILSTNIAESGVTIDDVGAVIDVGRAKEKAYVSTRGTTTAGSGQFGSVSQLLTVYASRANCVQRRGRVGRTRPGVCIRLYSKDHFDSLHEFQKPEMLRTPLDSLCLQILSLDLGDPAVFLERALEPPTREHVESAMHRLHDLGATTSKRQLTPLGLRLAMLPVEPKMGKVIILGALLRCLDSALTIASVAQTDVFVSARSSREAVRLHKEDLSKNTQSDPIASVNGFNFWVAAHYQRSPAEVVAALQERLLSVPQLMMVSRHKRQFYEILKDSGFLACDGGARRKADPTNSTSRDIFVDQSSLSEDALDVGLVKCIVAAGLFPNVAILQGRRSLRTKLQKHVSTSSDSVLHRTAQDQIQQPYFVFSEIAKSAETAKLSARDLTNISLWTLLLMGTGSMSLTFDQEVNLAFVDDWIPFRISFTTLEMVRKLKRVLHDTLSRAYTNPADEGNNARLETIRQILKELVNSPVKPNALRGGETMWSDSGVIVKPEMSRCVDAEAPAGGTAAE